MQQEDYVQKKLLVPKITSVLDFQTWWEQSANALGYHFSPAADRIETLSRSNDLDVLLVPIKISWQQDNEMKNAEITWTIPAVKRGDFWFLTAGYFWPSGSEDAATPTT